MTDIDFSELDDDSFVIHFGGKTGEMRAETFGLALVEFAAALRAVNLEVNPGFTLDVLIEANGEGSFRARLRTLKAAAGTLFSVDDVRNVVLALLASFLYDQIKPADKIEVQVTAEYVVVQHGSDKVVVPRSVEDLKEKVRKSPAVARHVARTMEVLEADKSVTSFGIAREMGDAKPMLEIPRSVFPVVREAVTVPPVDGERSEIRDAVLTVIKAVFERSKRKWEFVYGGFRISAPILDQDFFDRMADGKVSIRQGDAFKAKLRVHQKFDPLTHSWINTSYEVIEVGDVVRKAPDQLSAGF